MPHADDIALADEKMGLAEGDAALDKLRGARDDEQRVTILFQLRPLVGMFGVLDRQIMQAELMYAGDNRDHVTPFNLGPNYNKRIGGKWLDIHDHISVPVDMATGKGALDLKP